MSIRDILVLLDGNASSDERLKLAAALAKEHDAFLSGAFLEDAHETKAAIDLPLPGFQFRTAAPDTRRIVFADAVREASDFEHSFSVVNAKSAILRSRTH